jgi:hypothetical protein
LVPLGEAQVLVEDLAGAQVGLETLMIATSIASLRPDNMNEGPAPATDWRSEKWTFT